MTDQTSEAATRSPKKSLGFLIWRGSRLIAALMEDRCVEQDVSFSQWLTLMLIGSGDATNGADLARLLGYNSGAVTRQIDPLERRGLIERRRSGEDRRVVKLVLTPQGLDAAQALKIRANGMIAEFVEDFTAAEAELLMGLLGRLLDKLETLSTAIGEDAWADDALRV